MYNTEIPDRSELPSSKQLFRSTLISIVVAAVLLVTVVLPAEYGIDPTRIGGLLGLTQMGQTKMALAREAAQDRKNAPPEAASVQPQSTTKGTSETNKPRKDTISVTLKPGQGAEIKLEMTKGAKIKYEWVTSGGNVNHDTHGDSPNVKYHGYSKGLNLGRDEGELVAVFDGKHGWFWRNRGSGEVTVTLKTSGEYLSITRVA